MAYKKSVFPYLIVGMVVFVNFGLTDEWLFPLVAFVMSFSIVYLIRVYKEHSVVQKIVNLF